MQYGFSLCAGHWANQAVGVHTGASRGEATRLGWSVCVSLSISHLVLLFKASKARKQKKKSCTTLSLFSVETNTAKQLQHFKLACVSLVGSTLASEQYAAKVTAEVILN